MKNKTAQITAFLLVGMLILITFGFVYYVASTMITSKIRTEQTEKIPLEIQPVKTYIETCLDGIAKEGLDLIGKQGGYIYQNQGGMVKCCPIKHEYSDAGGNKKSFSSDVEEFDSYNSSYWIYALGSLGYVKMPDLEPRIILSWQQAGINFFVPASPPSILNQLENFTKLRFSKNCTDLSVFEQFDISKNTEPKVKVNLGRYDVQFDLTWPIEIKYQGKKTKISSFSVKENIRLKLIYSLARNIAFDDARDIDYHLISDGNSNRYFPSIKIQSKKFSYDIIEITDNESILYGKPYILSFIRENRIPYTKLKIVNSMVTIEAKDADEDYLTINDTRFEKIDETFVWKNAPDGKHSFIISDQRSKKLIEAEIE